MISLRPDIKGMTAENITKIEGKRSPFYIKKTSFHPQAGYCYFYGDAKYQFFFYLDTKPSLKGGIFDINQATTGRLTGGRPRIAKSDLEDIKVNITQLFCERNFFLPEKPVREGEVPEQVLFTWRLEQ